MLPFVATSGSALSAVAGRIVAAVAKASRPLTKDALRRRVAGSEDDYRRGLREALAAGQVKREGLGRKGRPFLYSRGEK